MKTAKKIIISMAIIISIIITIYLVSEGIIVGRWFAIIPAGIIALPFVWIRKKIIKGDIRSIELKKTSDFGDPIETIAVLEKNDVDTIAAMFNRKAKLFFDDDFEYSGYAFHVEADKPVIFYPQKNNMKYIKINESTWSVDLSSREGEELNQLIQKYISLTE